MDFKGLLITRTKSEMFSGLIVVLSFVIGLAQALVAKETRVVTLGLLLLFSLAALVWFVVLVTRPAFTVRGYKDVMALLARLAKTSRHRLWTVRSHTGVGTPENAYFEAIEDRLRDRAKPLEDFRRIVRFCPNAYNDLKYLISCYYRQNNVEVRYYQNHGPQFDFMIVDGKIGVIGFPMAGGKGNIGAVVLRRHEEVEGLETIFNTLCGESQLLFEGDARNEPRIEADLQKKLTKIFAMPTADR